MTKTMIMSWGLHCALVCARSLPLQMSPCGCHSVWTTGHRPQLAIAHQRRHSSRTSGPVVYIYRGRGTTSTCYSHMHHSLSRCLDHTVLPIGADSIVKGQLEENCAAIVFGGGYTEGYVQALGARGTQAIRDYVLGGGTYVGVCAGAYFASDLVIFRQRGQSQIVRRRPLSFYPGTCVGPVTNVYDHWQDPSDGHYSVTFLPGGDDVTVRGDVTAMPDVITVKAYVNGGGLFLPHCSERGLPDPRVTTLAYFGSLGLTSAAVVKCQVGQGVAVLSGPHLEMTSLADEVIGEAWWRWTLRQGRLKTLTPMASTSASASALVSGYKSISGSLPEKFRPFSNSGAAMVEFG